MDSCADAPSGEDQLVIDGVHLVNARRLVETCLLHPAGDAVADEDHHSEAAVAYHAAADLMARLGWPDDPRRSVRVTPAEVDLIRLAALAGLGAAAEAIDDTTSAVAVHGTHWDADGALTDFEEIVALLDVIGWPEGSVRQPVPRGLPAPEEATLVEFGRRLPTPMWLLDAAGRIEHRNPAAIALLREFGLTESVNPVFELIHPDDRASVGARVAAARAEQRGFRDEVRIGDAGARRFILSGAPRFDPSGGFLGFMVLGIDVPGARRSALHWGTDASGALVSASAGLLEHLGIGLTAALGDGWISRVHPDHRDRLRRALRIAHEWPSALSQPVLLGKGDGIWRPARLEAEPRLEASGFAGLSGVVIPADGDLR